MGLIEVVKKAQRLGPLEAQAAGLSGLKPTWLVSEDACSAEVGNNELVSWRGVPVASDLLKLREEQEDRLISELKAKADDSPSLDFLDGLLRSYFEQVLDPSPSIRPNPRPNPNPASEKKEASKASFHKLLRRTSPHIGQKLLSLILRTCLACEDFDGVKAMLESHAVSGNVHLDLVSSLIDHDQTALLCTWVRNVCDPRFSDLLLILKYFLKSSLPASNSLAQVRKQWRQMAASAIQRVSEIVKAEGGKGDGNTDLSPQTKQKNVKEEAVFKALLLSAAVDYFQPYELCLHYLVSSGQDEAVLTSIFSQLDNAEVLKLLLYLKKWLGKYSRQSSLCAFELRRKDAWVPCLSYIIQWTSVLVDVHLMSLVLCSDFHEEVCSIQLSIKDFVELGHMLAPLVGVTEHLRTKAPLPSQASRHEEDDPVIEYVDI